MARSSRCGELQVRTARQSALLFNFFQEGADGPRCADGDDSGAAQSPFHSDVAFTDYGADDEGAADRDYDDEPGRLNYRALRDGVVTLLPSIVGFGLALLVSGATIPLFSRCVTVDSGFRAVSAQLAHLGAHGSRRLMTFFGTVRRPQNRRYPGPSADLHFSEVDNNAKGKA